MKYFFVSLYLILSIDVIADEVFSDVEPTIYIKDEKKLSCSPKEITKGGEIIVKMGQGHGKELSIYRHSDKASLFMVVSSPPEEMMSFMSPEKFKDMREFKINSKTTGFEWAAGGINQYILYKPSKYTIHVSEVLESEVGGYECDFEVKAH